MEDPPQAQTPFHSAPTSNHLLPITRAFVKMMITPLYGLTLALISVGLWQLCKRISNKSPLMDIPGPPSRSWWAGTSTYQVNLFQSITDYANQVTSFRYLATTRGIFSGISQKRLDPPCVQLGSWVWVIVVNVWNWYWQITSKGRAVMHKWSPCPTTYICQIPTHLRGDRLFHCVSRS